MRNMGVSVCYCGLLVVGWRWSEVVWEMETQGCTSGARRMLHAGCRWNHPMADHMAEFEYEKDTNIWKSMRRGRLGNQCRYCDFFEFLIDGSAPYIQKLAQAKLKGLENSHMQVSWYQSLCCPKDCRSRR